MEPNRKKEKVTAPSLINWAGASKEITGSPYQIRQGYRGKKYRRVVNRLRQTDRTLKRYLKANGNDKK